MRAPFKLAIIGLDSSHTIEFTRQMQGAAPPKVEGLRVVTALRFPSAFQSEEGQDKRQAQLEDWGVSVTRSLAEAVRGVDGVMLEINDPALHLEYFKQAAELGLPVYLDKPVAGNLEDAQAIVALARKKNVKVWTASALRFVDCVAETAARTPNALAGHVYGPLGKAPVGSSLVWYGIHSFEMLGALMGRGAQSVRAERDEHGVVSIVHFAGGRRAIVECLDGCWWYGGRAQSKDRITPFHLASTETLYDNLVRRFREFFIEGKIPVSLDEMLEVQALMDAAERSLESGREEALRRTGASPGLRP